MAEALIKVAAQRYLKKADVLPVSAGIYDDFCARFPYAETEDQEKSIQDVLNDLTKGRPMDRLVCGDVGFGKTEVALRAAFTAAMNGVQVAVVVPTTLCAPALRNVCQTSGRISPARGPAVAFNGRETGGRR